ncbi:MAG TPA: NAD(P)/FAD-dependent oxidoreductase [Gemmatimonadales bacterium]|jgi:phytoene dehydrogenase-like protein|nr:NAD(P)/FAD-dependent oxidoreductase [Gemmatimonadales bacterium]
MTARYDAIVIGAGVNGLVAAGCLARAGTRVLVLERSEAVGGQGRLLQFAPGFRADPLGRDAGWLPPKLARELGLRGLDLLVPDPTVSVRVGEAEWLALTSDVVRSAQAIRPHSPGDAARWSAFCARIAALAGFLQVLYTLPAPDIAATAPGELLSLLGVARKLRGLGRADMIELLRTVPMSVAELLDDWFESAPLKAAVGASGVTELRQGPRSGGTAFVLLHHQVGAPAGAIRGRGYWRTGPDALIRAAEAAARGRGAEVRNGAEVARVVVEDDRATGVILASGEEIAARLVVSTADPARTLLGFVDPVWLDPEFLLAVRNIKYRGSAAKVLYALDELPEFPGLPDPPRALAGVVTLARSLEELERAADAAKYGRVSERPLVEIEVPSLRWPSAQLAPAGRHVLVAHVQWTPHSLREGAWDAARRAALGDLVTAAIAEAAPCFGERVRERMVLAPPDLEARYGLTEGAVTHGEMTLDQILFMRPVAGSARYATPIGGLYLAGAGTHPGGGIPGGPGWLAARQVLADRRR